MAGSRSARMISWTTSSRPSTGAACPGAARAEYKSIDEALLAMEKGIKAFLEEQGFDMRPSPKRRPPKRSAKKAGKPPSRAGEEQHRSKEEQKVIRKIQKLDEIAEGLRQGQDFPVTRLTILKGLCEDPEAAGAFALFLTRKVQRTLREKRGPKRYRQLVNRAVREIKPYLEEPGEERRERLWSLWHEMKEEQDEYKPISWGMVRIVKEHGPAGGREVPGIGPPSPTKRRPGSIRRPGITPSVTMRGTLMA